MSTKRKPIPPPEIVTSIRLTQELHDGLRDLAAGQHRSISQQVRHMVETELAKQEAA